MISNFLHKGILSMVCFSSRRKIVVLLRLHVGEVAQKVVSKERCNVN